MDNQGVKMYAKGVKDNNSTLIKNSVKELHLKVVILLNSLFCLSHSSTCKMA